MNNNNYMQTVTWFREQIAIAMQNGQDALVRELLEDIDAMHGIEIATTVAYDFGLTY